MYPATAPPGENECRNDQPGHTDQAQCISDPPRAYSIMAYSQSDDPKSPHYNDQCEMFAKGEWKPVFFTEADIAANLERSYRP